MRPDPRVSLSVTDLADPYRMAAVQGLVLEVRTDPECFHMNVISRKYTSAGFPARGPHRVCFVVGAIRAGRRDLEWPRHDPTG